MRQDIPSYLSVYPYTCTRSSFFSIIVSLPTSSQWIHNQSEATRIVYFWHTQTLRVINRQMHKNPKRSNNYKAFILGTESILILNLLIYTSISIVMNRDGEIKITFNFCGRGVEAWLHQSIYLVMAKLNKPFRSNYIILQSMQQKGSKSAMLISRIERCRG